MANLDPPTEDLQILNKGEIFESPAVIPIHPQQGAGIKGNAENKLASEDLILRLRDNLKDLVDIGGDGFEFAIGVGAREHAVSLQLGYDHAGGVALAPDHAITGDQAFYVGAQVAALADAGLRLYGHLGAVVGDNQALAFGPEVAAGQCFFGRAAAFGRSLGAFVLDFLYAPGLLATQFTF